MQWNEKQFNKGTGKALQLARRAAGKTQEDIAKVLGVARTSITNMEAGRQAISLYHAALLADVLPEWAGNLTKRALDEKPSSRSLIHRLLAAFRQ
jgi:DNA-binding XRE family transcriptional regulator